MPGPAFTFAEFTLDPSTSTLSRDGVRVSLEPQPTRLLEQLVLRAGEVVDRNELARTLWSDSGTHVSVDDGLNYAVRQIRTALGDDARQPRFLVTVPRRGYRFVAPVSTVVPDCRPARIGLAARSRSWVALALAAAMGLLIVESRPNNHHEVTMRVLRAVHRAIF